MISMVSLFNLFVNQQNKPKSYSQSYIVKREREREERERQKKSWKAAITKQKPADPLLMVHKRSKNIVMKEHYILVPIVQVQVGQVVEILVEVAQIMEVVGVPIHLVEALTHLRKRLNEKHIKELCHLYEI